MSEINDSTARNIMAYGYSILLHAGVIALFFAFSSGKAQSEANDGQSAGDAPALESAAADRPTPVPTTREELVEQSTVRPEVATGAGAAVSSRTTPQESSPLLDAEHASVPPYHVVRPGDTLTKIAALYHTTPQQLAKLNGKKLSQMNTLFVNQKLKLR